MKLRILIISPYYAPSSLVGAQRMLSLSTYLRDKSHQVSVISFSDDYFHKEAPDSSHASVPESICRIGIDGKIGGGHHAWERANAALFSKAVEEILQKKRFDLIVASCGPFFPLRFLPSLSKKYGIPFFVDYRDLNVFYDVLLNDYTRFIQFAKAKIMQRLQFWIERKSARSATAVIVVTPGDQVLARNKFNIENVHVVLNGFDESQMRQVNRQKAGGDIFRIGVFGKFMYYSEESGYVIFSAIKTLRQDGTDVKLLHVGPKNPHLSNIFRKLKVDETICEERGMMNYLDGLNVMASMQLLAIDYRHPTGFGTKVFDYIGLNKPILLIAPENTALSHFVKGFKNGYVCQTVEQVLDTIRKVMDKGITQLDENLDVDDYSRLIQNERFEEILLASIPTRGDTAI